MTTSIRFILVLIYMMTGLLLSAQRSDCIKQNLTLPAASQNHFNKDQITKEAQKIIFEFLDNLEGVTRQYKSYDSIQWSLLRLTSQDFSAQVFYMDGKSNRLISRNQLLDEIRQFFRTQGFFIHSNCFRFEEVVFLEEFGILRVPVLVDVLLPNVLESNSYSVIPNSQKISLRFNLSFDGLSIKINGLQRVSEFRAYYNVSLGFGPSFSTSSFGSTLRSDLNKFTAAQFVETITNQNIESLIPVQVKNSVGFNIDLRVSVPLNDGKKYNIPLIFSYGNAHMQILTDLPPHSSIYFETSPLNIISPNQATSDILLLYEFNEKLAMKNFSIGIGLSRFWQIKGWKISLTPELRYMILSAESKSIAINGHRIGYFGNGSHENDLIGFFSETGMSVNNELLQNYGRGIHNSSAQIKNNQSILCAGVSMDFNYSPPKSYKISYLTRIGFLTHFIPIRATEFLETTTVNFTTLATLGLTNYLSAKPLNQSFLQFGINYML